MTFDELFKKCDKDNNKILFIEQFVEILKESNDGLAKIQWIVKRGFDAADANEDNSLSYEEAF
jgi:Ca2+-binding EF-hand superfamily protein